MKVQVRLFARYREEAGHDRVELDLPEGGTVEAAWEAVTSRFPALSAYRPFTLFAVGNDYVLPDRPLHGGEELCLFPPVSGGARGGAAWGGPWRRHAAGPPPAAPPLTGGNRQSSSPAWSGRSGGT